jgi:hypothetical protein
MAKKRILKIYLNPDAMTAARENLIIARTKANDLVTYSDNTVETHMNHYTFTCMKVDLPLWKVEDFNEVECDPMYDKLFEIIGFFVSHQNKSKVPAAVSIALKAYDEARDAEDPARVPPEAPPAAPTA